MKITIEAIVNRPSYVVWEFWNYPEHIVKWNFASPDWHCPRAQNDLRVGGRFRSRMEAKDGSFGFDFEGTYERIQAERNITYVMPDGRRVSSDFESMGSRTRITTIFDGEEEYPLERQRDGWQAILNKFKEYAESQ